MQGKTTQNLILLFRIPLGKQQTVSSQFVESLGTSPQKTFTSPGLG